MPPAFYKYDHNGVVNFYSKLIEAVPNCKIILYNFEKLSGYKFDVDTVLLKFDADGKDVTIGAPTIDGAKVTFKVLEHKLGDKVRVYKMNAKKRYRRNKGHRQAQTVLEVVEVA